MENHIITPNSPNVVSENFDGEVILVNLVNGNYYSLRNTGANVWKLIEQKRSYADLLQDVSSIYQADDSVVESVESFIQQLSEQQLIKTAPLNGYQSAEADFKFIQPGNFEPPVLEVYSDMQDLLLLDPIHDVDEDSGWPQKPQGE